MSGRMRTMIGGLVVVALLAGLVATELGVAPANAQAAVDRLVEYGVLEQVGSGARDRVWQATDVLDAMDRFVAGSHRRS